MSLELKGTIYAIISGLMYGGLGYFGIMIINEGFSIPNMTFWRFFISSIIVLVILIASKNLINENPKESLKALICGSVFYGISTMVYFVSSEYIGTGLAMVIFFTDSAIVMIINRILYGTKITKSYFLAIVIIIVGLVLLVDIKAFEFDIIGIFFGILSALFFAFYICFSQNNTVSPLFSTLMVSIGCSISSLIFAIIDNSFAIPTSINLWINIISIAVICTALPILFFLEALKHISSVKTSILGVLEPVFVIIVGVLFLDEKITFIQLLGILIILSGAMFTLSIKNISNITKKIPKKI